ncbi:MAG: hypothetical protein R6W85_04195 [Gillisia sp.]
MENNNENRNENYNEKINEVPKKKNIWNLVLGLLFLIYGSYRLYVLSENNFQDDTLSLILAIGFIAFGLYDLWKYNKGL